MRQEATINNQWLLEIRLSRMAYILFLILIICITVSYAEEEKLSDEKLIKEMDRLFKEYRYPLVEKDAISIERISLSDRIFHIKVSPSCNKEAEYLLVACRIIGQLSEKIEKPFQNIEIRIIIQYKEAETSVYTAPTPCLVSYAKGKSTWSETYDKCLKRKTSFSLSDIIK